MRPNRPEADLELRAGRLRIALQGLRGRRDAPAFKPRDHRLRRAHSPGDLFLCHFGMTTCLDERIRQREFIFFNLLELLNPLEQESPAAKASPARTRQKWAVVPLDRL